MLPIVTTETLHQVAVELVSEVATNGHTGVWLRDTLTRIHETNVELEIFIAAFVDEADHPLALQAMLQVYRQLELQSESCLPVLTSEVVNSVAQEYAQVTDVRPYIADIYDRVNSDNTLLAQYIGTMGTMVPDPPPVIQGMLLLYRMLEAQDIVDKSKMH